MPTMLRFTLVCVACAAPLYANDATLLFVVSQKGTKKQIGCRWLDRAKVFEDELLTERYKMHTLLYYEFVLRV